MNYATKNTQRYCQIFIPLWRCLGQNCLQSKQFLSSTYWFSSRLKNCSGGTLGLGGFAATILALKKDISAPLTKHTTAFSATWLEKWEIASNETAPLSRQPTEIREKKFQVVLHPLFLWNSDEYEFRHETRYVLSKSRNVFSNVSLWS